MSRSSKPTTAGPAQTKGEKEVLTVVLPQFPKQDDAKVQRSRWVQEYDRVQHELLRPHLSSADNNGAAATATLSLRQLPDDWEEQLRLQQAQKAQLEAIRLRALEKKRKERGGSINNNNNGSIAAGRDLNTTMNSPSRQLAANSPSYYKTGPKDFGGGNSPVVGNTSSLLANRSGMLNGSSSLKGGGGDRSTSARNNDRSAALSKARAATADLYSTNQSTFKPTAAANTPPPRSRSRMTGTADLSPIRPLTSSPAPTTAYSRSGYSPSRMKAEGNTSSAFNETVTTTFNATRMPTTHECARIINTLLLPPAHFKASVQPNLAHIDLRWIRRYKAGHPVTAEMTLDSMREDIYTAPSSNTTALNSPRSTIVLLRNGCSVDDLQMRPMEWFRSGKNKAQTAHNSSSLALGPSSQSMAMNEELAGMAQRHFEERRQSLAASLRAEYRNLCREVSQLDLLETCLHLRAVDEGATVDDEAASDVTFLNARKDKLAMRRQLEEQQIGKQKLLAEQLRKKAAENEEKRYLADLEHKRQLEAKREEAFQRQRDAEKRQELLRQQTDKLQEEYKDKLNERRHRLDLKEQKMTENRLAHREEVRRMAQEKAKKREARMERQQELQEELVKEMLTKRREQEEMEFLRRQQKEAELAAHKEQVAHAQRVAQERREESKRAAEEYEEAVRARALEKTEIAAAKLREFHQKQQQKRSEQAAEEAKKNELRQRAFEAAAELQEKKAGTFVAKRTAHEARYAEMEAANTTAIAKDQERERQIEDDKRLYVRRRTMAVQFDQLMSIANIERKREKGEAVAKQRDKLVDLTLKEREKLRLQKERYDEELYTKAVSNQL